MKRRFRINGTGCALADYVYSGIDFKGSSFQKFNSRNPGDGGLAPGKLVFTEELEKFAGLSYQQIISEITDNRDPDIFNIGGPSLVSLIHAAQVLNDPDYEVHYYGMSGNDSTSHQIKRLLQKTPIHVEHYHSTGKLATPFTHVLSDPTFDNGHGERTFINNIGAAWELDPQLLQESFFEADLLCFGGTALTPGIHDNLHLLLSKARAMKAFTLVNTVYDFRNEKQNPGKPWPLGKTEESLPSIDLLIMDNEEALNISGSSIIEDAFKYFRTHCPAFIITRGSLPVLYFSSGATFMAAEGELPVSEKVTRRLLAGQGTEGDTTGCGDNFTGGIIAELATQLMDGTRKLNLQKAVVAGICAGGFACFYKGGTWFEERKGEKKQLLEDLVKDYNQQQLDE